MEKAVVLLSGGQDSVTSLFWALTRFEVVAALSINYGQRHITELAAARIAAKVASVPHYIIELPEGLLGAGSALVDKSLVLEGSGGIVDKEMPEGLPTSFVPGRNLLFFNIAAIFGAACGAKDIVSGICQTDYSGYPDCRREFVDALEAAITLAFPSSMGPVVIHTPLMRLTKKETVELALKLGASCWDALSSSVTCYYGKIPGCRKCPACILRAKGFQEAGIDDPAFV